MHDCPTLAAHHRLGSTLSRFAEAIPPDCALRIVTNSLRIAQVLSDHDTDVVVIGGKLRKNYAGHGRR
ncbi:MAG: hypothetical protein R2695_08590 [Acidimicrobiales bacterium]